MNKRSRAPAAMPGFLYTLTMASVALLLAITVSGCDEENEGGPGPFPAADAWGETRGPGVPPVTFDEEELFANCAFLDGGPLDTTDHHNLAVMFDGFLLLPWAPEWGEGGLTFFDLSAPCSPTVAGAATSTRMRETHSLGFSQYGDRWFTVVNQGTIIQEGEGGVQLWDVTDISAPQHVVDVNLPGFFYPDAYARIVLSVFFQAPYIYAAHADLGIGIIDASDPENPVHIRTIPLEPVLRIGQIQAVGNLLIVTGAETPDTALFDISDPENPVLLPNGRFQVVDSEDSIRAFYFSNFIGGHIYYARKDGGGGVIIYDVRDPLTPRFVGDYPSEGNGGYVFVHEGMAFVGESSFGTLYDVRDPAAIEELGRFELEGDLDTVTPIGHLAIVSVDDDANDDEGSAVAPWRREPDSSPPVAEWVWPQDGATDVARSSRIGIAFNEMIEPVSAFAGSVRLYIDGEDPDATRVDGYISTQETIVNFAPRGSLRANTTYRLDLPVGGLSDYSGNRLAEPFSTTFTTGP